MMLSKLQQRGLAFVLAFAITFSLVPVTGFATETEPVTVETTVPETESAVMETTVPETEPVVETTAVTEAVTEPTIETEAATEPEAVSEIEPVTETVPVDNSAVDTEVTEGTESLEDSSAEQIQSRIQAILTQYGVTAEMTDNEIAAAIFAVDGDTLKATVDEMDAIEQAAMELTEEEFQTLDIEILDCYGHFISVMEQLFTPAVITTVDVLDGQVSISDTANKNTLSNNVVTLKATGNMFSAATNTITITNETNSQATLKFDYSASNCKAFTIAGGTAASSGTYSATLNAGASITVAITSNSGFGWGIEYTATLTLSNFSLTVAAAKSNVTFNFDSSLGSVTVGGTAITSGTVQEISIDTGAALVATPSSGVTFLGWIDEGDDGIVISTTSSYTLKPSADTTVRAVFASTSSSAWFLVNNSYLFNDLNQAATKASTKEPKLVVLAANGTLPANEDGYTIPTGVTLLIPRDSANSVDTTKAGDAGADASVWKTKDVTYEPASCYRKLTMASGAAIAVDGAISVAGKAGTNQGSNGAPFGPLGYISMNSGSSITINSGGKLYAWGHITGSGSVTVKSNGTIYEGLQIADWRGGDIINTLNSGKKVFPFSQYYIQNVEVPLTLEAGATEEVYTACTVTLLGKQDASTTLIGSEAGLFRIQSGSLTRTYKGDTDRIHYDIDGTVTLNNITVSINVTGWGSVSMNSANFSLPLNGNMTINVNSGSNLTVENNVSLLPGSQVNIAQGSTVTLAKDVGLIVYDRGQWGNDYCAAAGSHSCLMAVRAAPGRTKSRSAASLVDAAICVNGTLDASLGYLYTTTESATYATDGGTHTWLLSDTSASGANIHSTENGTIKLKAANSGTTYWYKQIATDDKSAKQYINIPITSAKLKNGNGEYVDTSSKANTYTYIDGYWRCKEHTDVMKETVAPTCAEKGYTTYSCSVCGYEHTDYVETTAHNYESVTTDPTCNKAGYTTYTCSACGNSYVDDETSATGDHKWSGGICSVCGEKFSFYKANVELHNSLNMKFAFPMNVSTSWDGFYVLIERIPANGDAATTEKISSNNWTTNGGYNVVTYTGLAAKEMCDTLKLTVYNGNNQQVSHTWEDSMRKYAMRILDDPETESVQQTLAVDFLNYGAAAQTHFDYAADNLANSQMNDTQKGWGTSEEPKLNSGLVRGNQWKGSNLILENNIRFLVAFKGLNTTMSAVVKYTSHTGEEIEETVSGDKFGKSGSYYYVAMDSLENKPVVADARQVITITIYDGNDEYTTCEESIEDYLARYDYSDDVNIAVMKFADSAYAWLHRNDSQS